MCFSLVANTRTLDLAASDDVSLDRWLKSNGEMMSQNVVVVTASPAAQEIVTSPLDGKTKERWRRKMGKYVRGVRARSARNFNRTSKIMRTNPVSLIDQLPPQRGMSGRSSSVKLQIVDTALLLSCQAGHDTRLLRNGASVDPHPDVGGSALHCAVSGEHLSCVKAILEEQPDSRHNLNDPIFVLLEITLLLIHVVWFLSVMRTVEQHCMHVVGVVSQR